MKEPLVFDKYQKYSKYIKDSKNLIVIFVYSKSCSNEAFNDGYSSLSDKYYDFSVKFLKLEIEKHKNIEKMYFLTGVPCFLLFKKSSLIYTINGYNLEILDKQISYILNTDLLKCSINSGLEIF